MAHTHIAIIGDGPASLILLAVLRDAGVSRGAVAIYGDGPNPLANLQKYATSVHQRVMRSEGDGHLHPRNFPDLTWQDAWKNRTLFPFWQNLFNRYNPPLNLLLEHAAEVAREFDFEGHRLPARVGCIKRPTSSLREFDLLDGNGQYTGRARHVVLALGHPGLNWPVEFEAWRGDPRVAHAYERPTCLPGERVVVVGGGIAAAHVWLAALDVGAEVIALHRKPLRHQPLNAPRCMFNDVGIQAYRRLGADERIAQLRSPLGSSYPNRPNWERQLEQARKNHHFRVQQARITNIQGKEGPLTLWLDDRTAIECERLIFATGFKSDPLSHPVLQYLAANGDVRLREGYLQADDDFTLPPISHKNSVLAVTGTMARFALPVSDTFVGMKYIARRLVPLLKR